MILQTTNNGGNQNRDTWSKIKVYIPINATIAQITAMPPSANWLDNRYGDRSYVPEVDIVYDNPYSERANLFVYVFYWGGPWTLYFGFDQYARSCFVT